MTKLLSETASGNAVTNHRFLNIFKASRDNQWLTPLLHMNEFPWELGSLKQTITNPSPCPPKTKSFPIWISDSMGYLGLVNVPERLMPMPKTVDSSQASPKADAMDETGLWLWNFLAILVIWASKCVDKVYIQQNKATHDYSHKKLQSLGGIIKKSSIKWLPFLHLKNLSKRFSQTIWKLDTSPVSQKSLEVSTICIQGRPRDQESQSKYYIRFT